MNSIQKKWTLINLEAPDCLSAASPEAIRRELHFYRHLVTFCHNGVKMSRVTR